MDHNFPQCPPAVQKQNLCSTDSMFNAIVKDKICKIWLPRQIIVQHITPIKPQCAVFILWFLHKLNK